MKGKVTRAGSLVRHCWKDKGRERTAGN